MNLVSTHDSVNIPYNRTTILKMDRTVNFAVINRSSFTAVMECIHSSRKKAIFVLGLPLTIITPKRLGAYAFTSLIIQTKLHMILKA